MIGRAARSLTLDTDQTLHPALQTSCHVSPHCTSTTSGGREVDRERERERESDGKGGWDPGKAKRSKPVNLLIRTVERLIVWKLVDDPLADLHLFSVRGVWVLSCAPPSSVATCGPECHGTLASSPKTVRSENSCAEGSWFSFMSCTSDASKLAF